MIGRLRALFRDDGLRGRTFRGTLLSLFGFGGAMALRFGSNLVLTRILFPEAFGIMTLVTVVLNGVQMFSTTGINTSIIQNRRGDDPAFLNTAWVVQILRGLLLWLIVIAIAGPVAGVYDQPELAQLLPVAGASALLLGFQSTKLASANRHLALGRLTLLELGSQAFGIVVTVILAAATQSVWSLVAGNLVGVAAKTVLSHRMLPGPGNRLQWDRTAFSELFHFGKYIFLGSIAGFFINNGDRAILGKFVSLGDLAVYSIAFFLATVPLTMAQQLNNRVLMPLYARIPPKENPRNRQNIRKARSALTAGLLAMGLVLGLIGDPLVRFLYTGPYHQAGPILVLLAMATLPQIVTAGYGMLLLSAGRSRDFTLLVAFTALIQTGLLLAGVQAFGLMGAIAAPAAATLLSYPLTAWLAQREGGWDPWHDALGLAAILAMTALVLLVNGDAVARVLPGSGG